MLPALATKSSSLVLLLTGLSSFLLAAWDDTLVRLQTGAIEPAIVHRDHPVDEAEPAPRARVASGFLPVFGPRVDRHLPERDAVPIEVRTEVVQVVHQRNGQGFASEILIRIEHDGDAPVPEGLELAVLCTDASERILWQSDWTPIGERAEVRDELLVVPSAPPFDITTRSAGVHIIVVSR
ncbi:MAG: hypothetical protein AAF726_21705 [Planctomycetota bacterium]